MMKIFSIGDMVNISFLDWSFSIHSVFKEVINLETQYGIVSFVLKSIGGGPNNIVVDSLYENFDSFVFKKEIKFDLSNVPMYDSTFHFCNADKIYLMNNIYKLEYILINESNSKSAAFLLDEKRLENFKTPLEINLARRIQIGFQKLLNFDISAVETLKGLGYGLTPQGDDLIDGFIAALFFYETCFNISTYKLRKEIYMLALTNNKLSNTFLYYTSRGLFYERFKNVLLSLVSGENIEHTVKSMLAFGETSGADILTGFLKGIKILLEGGSALCQ